MRKIIPILMMALGLMAACSTLDCPLNNTVYTKYRLAGNITTLTDTLTISTNRIEGTDSVLINKDVNVDSFILPMSYSLLEDSLFFETRNADNRLLRDTVTVQKTNTPHFESVDCKPSFFHTITGVKTTHNSIDSIVINCKEVTYDETKPHFYIYFGHRDQRPDAADARTGDTCPGIIRQEDSRHQQGHHPTVGKRGSKRRPGWPHSTHGQRLRSV